MTKLSLYCTFLFAAVLTAQCSSGMEDLESTAVNPPTECERREKLDLKAAGAELEFEIHNPLDARSSYGLSIDGYTSTKWKDCTVSSFAGKIDFWIDLQNIYPIDHITLLSRLSWGYGAEVFVGNFSAAKTTENQQKCGASHPEGSRASPPPRTEFRCHGTHWVQYVRIRRYATSSSSTTLQICEVELFYDGYKYDLKKLNPRLSFEVDGLSPRSSYNLATDGNPSLRTCAQSNSASRPPIQMKVDLHKAYAVSKIRLLSPQSNLYRIFVSNSSDFASKTECNQENFYEFMCSLSAVQHILVDSRSATYLKVCEIEVYYKPDEEPRQNPPELPCGFPPHLPKSTMTTDWETATYTCKDGLAPVQQTATCLSSGRWSRALQQCKPKGCSELRHPVHGDVSLPSDLIKGATAKYSCAVCYEMDGDEKRQCLTEDNGNTLKWSGSEPACKVVHCGEAPTVEKATLKVVSKTCGGVASYKCVGERTLFGSPHLLCGPQGKWMGTVPKCVDIPRY